MSEVILPPPLKMEFPIPDPATPDVIAISVIDAMLNNVGFKFTTGEKLSILRYLSEKYEGILNEEMVEKYKGAIE